MRILNKSEYHFAKTALKKVNINNLFAQTVAEDKIDGVIYTDNAKIPTTFYIVHPYGMSLLFGEINNDEFNKEFYNYALNKNGIRKKDDWMQVFPNEWNDVIQEIFKNNIIKSSKNSTHANKLIELNTRVNFTFNKQLFEKLNLPMLDTNYCITQTSEEDFLKMEGSVVPLHFWKNSEQFSKEGIGFSLYYKNELVSLAFSSYYLGSQLEIGIETGDKFRGKGLARYVSAALINHCIKHNLEPIWSCRLENKSSYILAQKLGFEPKKMSPYYKLPY